MQELHDFMMANNLSWLDLGGTFVGLFYIYYQFKVSWKLWVASFVMALFYIALNLKGELFALAGIYIYYALAAVYGLWKWRFSKADTAQPEQPVRHLPVRLYLPVIAVTGMLTLVLAAVLRLLHEDATLWGDAFTSAASIVAMWILAQKYCEHWVFWVVVDCINCALYAYLGKQYLFSACLFGFYAVVCIFGYWYWHKKTLV